jgi:hypothetical protein
MNISINCKISLSKKLRSLLGKEGTITLTTSNLVDGKGLGKLSLTSEENTSSQFDTTETSIMITPIDVSDEIPSYSDTQSSIFSTIAPKGKEDHVTRKIAVVNAPEKKDIPKAMVKNVKTPDAFKITKDPECKNWIDNMSTLVEAINSAKNKQSNIDVSVARNDRERAVLMEQKEHEEAIGIPTWIVCDKVGSLTINDLQIGLTYNVPFNLGKISARRIAASRDLKSLIEGKYIKFIAPNEVINYVEKATGESERTPTLPVFDSPAEAEASITFSDEDIGGSVRNPVIDEKNSMEITEQNSEQPTEEESMIVNLTQNMPSVKPRTSPIESGVSSRHTVHGNSSAPQSEAPRAPSVKTIRKLS